MSLIIEVTDSQRLLLDESIVRLEGLLSIKARIDAHIALELAAHADEVEYQASLDEHPDAPDFHSRSLAADISAATRLPDRTIMGMMWDSQTLVRDFPETLNALYNGEILSEHAKVIQREARIITDQELLAQYEAELLPRAQTTTPTRLRTIARRLAEQFTDTSLVERHEKAKVDRDVFVQPLDDGMAKLCAILPATLAYGIHGRISQMAWAAKLLNNSQAKNVALDAEELGSPDARLVGQLRADLLSDLLLTGHPTSHAAHSHSGDDENTGTAEAATTGTRTTACAASCTKNGCGLGSIQARVQITIPFLALLPQEHLAKLRAENPALRHIAGLDGMPQLAGYGPIDPQTAKDLTVAAPGMDRLIVHPIAGSLLEVDRYRPNQDLRRFLAARDIHCRFPTCGTSLTRCEVDHTLDAALGGETKASNLANLCKLCRRRHNLHYADRRIMPTRRIIAA